MRGTIPERLTDLEYTQQILKKCKDNHIWLNKAQYMFPSDEQKLKLADAILDKLRCSCSQLPSEGITDECDGMRELAALTPILYLTVNWS